MADRLLLADALLEDPEAPGPTPGSLLVEDGRIAARLPADARGPEDALRIALAGLPLGPGLLDLHHHGELVLRAADGAADALISASASLVRHGVTAFLPATVAWPAPELASRVAAVLRALEAGGWPGAAPLALHLEGPWIRTEAAGAQPVAGIRPYDPAEGRSLLDRAEGRVAMVTFAPEAPGARSLVAELGRRGIVAAVGHTLASPDELSAAADGGARHATHLFNAMGPLHQRGPGVAASILADDRLSADVIADGAHVHPDWLRVAARVKGERLVLITDRIELPEGAVSFGSGRLESDGVAWRLPGGRLAGSHLRLDDALENCVRWRVMARHEAIRSATLAPARVLGIEAERGTLRPGARADLVLWDQDGAVRATWVAGRLVHGAVQAQAGRPEG
jgi:N-acetylglucosamine-6-phosphate deacetylase